MSKKLLFGLALSFVASSAFAQTIVSTTPENKKVILEEFTGINCVFCPDGHAIAQAIQDANPGNVFLVNIHTGGFANPGSGQPDFRTPFGAAIASQSGLVGYPAGTVNRHVFPGQSQSGNPNDTAMNRSAWTGASNTTLGEASYLNMGVEAEVDVQTNELTVHVEAYYTGDSPQATNKLNVVLLQNNTLGPQTGGNQGNNYNHQHRMVHMVTGQWGQDVSPTVSGTLIDETYSYTIPADYNGVPVELADLEIVVFMTETQQEIISGNGTIPSFVNLANANDANLRSINEVPELCSESYAPTVNIQNNGSNVLTSLDIEYAINSGTPQLYTWTGTLTSLQNVDVELPPVTFVIQPTGNTIDVSISNDDNNANNNVSTTFDQAVNGTGDLTMELNTDNWGSEVRWNIADEDGTVLYNGGPYGNNQTINESFQLEAGCFTFTLIDTYGDGGGAVTLVDSEGTIIFNTNGNYGSGATQNFGSDGVFLGTNDLSTPQIVMYPNPATSVLNIRNAENASLQVFDILGKELMQMSTISADQAIDVSSLQTGTYLVKITSGAAVTTEKFIIAR